MATISFAGSTQTQITVNIGHNGSAVNSFDLTCDGSSFSSGTFTQTTSHSAQRTKTGLTAGTSHNFVVRYYRGSTFVDSASGTWSTSPPTPALPSPLTGLSVSVSGTAPNATVTANWNASSGATAYSWSAAGQSGSVQTPGRSITVSSAGSYSFSVTPFNTSGNGQGDSRGFTVSNPTPPPNPPTGLSASSRSSLGTPVADLSWNASSGASSYRIYRSTTSGSGYSSINTTSSTSYTDTSTFPNVTYYYVVTAIGPGGESGFSNMASTIYIPPPPPPAPTGLTVTSVGSRRVSLSWNSVSVATSYSVLRGTTPGSYGGIASGLTGTTYTDTSLSLTNGTTYYYVVRAENDNGPSANSNQVSATPIAQVPVGTPIVTQTQVDLLDYRIAWSGVTGATSYEVWANGGAGFFKKGTTSSSFLVIHLDNFATTYTIQVRPLNADGYGTTGTLTLTTTETTPPTATITLTPRSTNVKVDWNIVDNPGPGDGGASGFRHMVVNISTPGNSTTYNVLTTSNSASGSYVFATDGLGDPMLPSTQYRFYFEISDNQFNELIVDRFVTTLAPVRPDNFAWTTAKVSGAPFLLTAAEWTRLANTVQEFRAYKGLSAYSIGDTGIPGWAFTAGHFNQMRAAIAGMSPPTSLPGTVSTGNPVFAAQLNGLRDSLNSIT